jgi:anti-sigma factor RsiW
MKHRECTSVRDLLALRPADWDESERQRAEEHLSACAECASLSRAYAAQDQALQELPAAGLGEAGRQRLFSRLELERTARLRPRPVWVFGAVFGAIALAAILLLASFLLWPGAGIWGVEQNDPTTLPARATVLSPTITPTTSLTPTPVGEKGLYLGLSTTEVAQHSPAICQASIPRPVPVRGGPLPSRDGEGP